MARKAPKVISYGTLVRSLTEGYGGFETAATTILLSDVDRALRAHLATGNRIIGQKARIYAADLETIKDGDVPRRLISGIVREVRPEDQLTFSVTIEDALSLILYTSFGEELQTPGYIPDEITDAAPVDRVTDAALHLAYGELSDEHLLEEALGVVPTIFTQTTSVFEELGNLNCFVICRGVASNIISIFGADYVNGGEEPTTRAKIPESAYGDWLFCPHKPGWPSPDPWMEINGHRYTVILAKKDHPVSILAREGRIPMTVNMCGYEEVGDGSGLLISSLPRQFLHWLINFVFNDWPGDTDWLPVPELDNGYSAIDTFSFEDVKDITEQRISTGYLGAFLINGDYRRRGVRGVIADFCRSGDFDLGVNKHGQIFLTMLDTYDTYETAPLLTDEHHILKGSFKIEPRYDEIENYIQYVFEKNYIQTLGGETQEEEEIAFREPYDGKWWSGLNIIQDAASIANLGGGVRGTRKSQLFELSMVRDPATAHDVAQRRLNLRKNLRMSGVLTLNLKGDDIELGDVVKIKEFQGVGEFGWSAQRCQIRRHAFSIDRKEIQLLFRDIDDIVGDIPGGGGAPPAEAPEPPAEPGGPAPGEPPGTPAIPGPTPPTPDPPTTVADFYVALDGDDADPGTFAEPFATFNHALEEAKAALSGTGKIIAVREGVYDQGIVPNNIFGTSWTNSIKVVNYNGETVWVRPTMGGQSPEAHPLFYERAQHGDFAYVEFNQINFDARPSGNSGVVIRETTGLSDPHHIRFKNLTVLAAQVAPPGSPFQYLNNCLIYGGHHHEFLGVTAHGADGYAFYHAASDSLLDGCDMSFCDSGGVHVYNGGGMSLVARTRVLRCRIHELGNGRNSSDRLFGILANGEDSEYSQNVLYKISTAGVGSGHAVIAIGAGPRVKVLNNIVADEPRMAAFKYDGATDPVLVNNISYGNLDHVITGTFFGPTTGQTEQNNSWQSPVNGANPMFIGPSSGDYHLQNTSPCIDKGQTRAEFSTDADGVARPQGAAWDQGAYEK